MQGSKLIAASKFGTRKDHFCIAVVSDISTFRGNKDGTIGQIHYVCHPIQRKEVVFWIFRLLNESDHFLPEFFKGKIVGCLSSLKNA